MTAAIYKLQTEKKSQFICSSCGADRGCDCNAPAVERLEELREQHRQRNRRHYENKKDKQNQRSSDVRKHLNEEQLNELAAEHAYRDQYKQTDPIQEECDDCETAEQHWQRSLSNIAGDAISIRAYWTRQFGGWGKFEVTSELVTLAKQAAEVWEELARELAKREK